MRIGIDARELCGHPTGVGRYLAGLLRQWSSDGRAGNHEFVLYGHAPIAIEARRFSTRVVPGGGGTAWEQTHLPLAISHDSLDVFFAPGYTGPLLSPVPTVVAIHDVSFAAHPEWFSLREGLRRRVLSRRTAARARAVITISEFSRRELIELLAVPAPRVHVIPPGIEAPATERSSNDADHGSVSEIRGLGPGSSGDRSARILYVGSIFNRRHVPELIEAFGIVARRHADASLHLVGDNRSFPYQDIDQAISRQRLGDRVRWHRYVSDADLGRLYRSARAFAFLSDYEGLGLTPLEALAVGVPSVLLDTAVARESCGDAAVYVGMENIAGVADALVRLITDECLRGALLGSAARVLARYDWTQAAVQTLAVIENAAS